LRDLGFLKKAKSRTGRVRGLLSVSIFSID
jgi:hypothetical protein